MRKRIKSGLIARATPNYVVQLQELPQRKTPYVRIFGEWKKIKQSEISIYKDFQIKWI